MTDEIHPVVALLAARMESHPEEFIAAHDPSGFLDGRWQMWLVEINAYLTEAEKQLLYSTQRERTFQRAHEGVLDELLNGEERRREKERKAEEDRKAWAQQAALAQQQVWNAQSQLGGQLSGLSQVQTWATNSYAKPSNPSLQLGNQTLDEGMIAKIKKALGL